MYGQHAPRPAQPLLASAVEMLGAGGVLFLLAGPAGEYGNVHRPDGSAVAALAYLVVFGSLIAYTTYEWLLHRAPARIVGTYAFVNPVVAVGLGWLLLDEPVGWRTGAAAAVIAAGVALIVTQRRPQERPAPVVRRRSRAARSSRCSRSRRRRRAAR